MAIDRQTPTAVVGGGLLGRLLALLLAERGQRVELFERGSAAGEQSAAYAAAAMLAPLAESVDSSQSVVDLGRQSLPLWREIIGRLPEKVFMQQNGSLLVWHPQDKPLAAQFERLLQRRGGSARHWSAADIAAQEPQLGGRFQAALFLPEEGQLDNRAVLDGLAAALAQHGVRCHWHTAAEPAELGSRYARVIDCRGFGAQAAWNRLPDKRSGSRLRGLRGEVARVYAPEVSLNRPVRLLHPRYPLYIAPKPDKLFVIGATQLESENDSGVSVRGGLELLSALYAVHPAFGEAEILELRSGLRPTLNHHDPEIRYSNNGSLIEINGLFRHGFMIAPAVAQAAVRLINTLDSGSLPECDSLTALPFIRTE